MLEFQCPYCKLVQFIYTNVQYTDNSCLMLVALLICGEKHEYLIHFNTKIRIMGQKYELG